MNSNKPPRLALDARQICNAVLLHFPPAVEARLRELEKTIYGQTVSPCYGTCCAIKSECYRPQAGHGRALWGLEPHYDPETNSCLSFLSAAPFRVARCLQENTLK